MFFPLNRFGAAFCALGCTLFLVSTSLAQGTADSRLANDQAAFETLENTQITIQFDQAECDDVLESLQGETGLTFMLDESAADNNLDPKTLISLEMRDMRAATALEFMLREWQCAWSIQDGVVVILSNDAALDVTNLGLMTFNCADVLEKIRPVKVRRYTYSPVPVVGSRGGFGGGVFSVAANQEDENSGGVSKESEDPQAEEKDPPKPPKPVFYEETISPTTQLKELIMSTVDPDSWEDNGGVGRMVSVNNLFVVRQTHHNLREIHHLLDKLRNSGLED